MNNLRDLVCGSLSSEDTGDLARCLSHMSKSLSVLARELRRRRRRRFDVLVFPFIVRSIVEVACTCLIGRLDPFRILTLAKIQGQGAYDSTERIVAAINWQGDILSKRVDQLWKTSRKSHEMSRALLGDYQDEVFWQPAFESLVDFLAQNGSHQRSEWLSNLLAKDTTSIVPFLRGDATQIYSKASKGVHHEFVLSMSSYYDEATLDQMAEDVVRLVAMMSLLSHFAENTYYALSPVRAISCFEALSP